MRFQPPRLSDRSIAHYGKNTSEQTLAEAVDDTTSTVLAKAEAMPDERGFRSKATRLDAEAARARAAGRC